METEIDLKKEIVKLSDKTKFSLPLLEKDYHLTRILHKISEKRITNLVFKGGTCLNKCYLGFYRLSEDLDFVYFVKKYVGIFLFNYLRLKSHPADSNLEILMESSKRFIPASVEQIKKVLSLLEKAKYLEAYKELINLPQVIFEEAGIFCMFIFD